MLELRDSFPFRIVDHHLHTKWSDGSLPPAELAQLGTQKGYRIGISDHAGPGSTGVQAASFDAYSTDLEQHAVLRAVEFDVAYGLPLEPPQAATLDYLIGSLHGVMRHGAFKSLDGMFRWVQSGARVPYAPDVDLSDPEVWIEEWLGILRHCFETTPIDILGHPTLTPVLPLDPDPERAYKPQWEERLCALAKEYDVALEISGRYKLPHERLLRTGRDMGVLFATGSDGHHRQQICDLTYPLEMIERVGIPPEQIFEVERAPRRVKIENAVSSALTLTMAQREIAR